MDTTETRLACFKVSPRFFWIAWGVLMFVCVAGLVIGLWQAGRPDRVSASAALIVLILGGLYLKRRQGHPT